MGEWTDHAWHASASPMHPAPNGAVSSTSIASIEAALSEPPSMSIASCGVGTRAAPPQPPPTLARAWSPAGEATRSSVGSSCGRAKSSRRPKRRLPNAAPDVAATVLQTAALPGPRRPAEAAPRPGQAPAGVAPCRRSTQQQRRSRACEHRPASASCGVGTRAAPPQPPHTLARAWSPAGKPPEAPSGPAAAEQRARAAPSAACRTQRPMLPRRFCKPPRSLGLGAPPKPLPGQAKPRPASRRAAAPRSSSAVAAPVNTGQPLRAAASAPGPRRRSRRTRSPGHGRPPASHPKLRRVQLRPSEELAPRRRMQRPPPSRALAPRRSRQQLGQT